MDREVVSNFILKNINKYKVYNFVSEKKFCRPDLRLTLDYKEDYLVIKSIYEALYSINPNFSALEIINFLTGNLIFKFLSFQTIPFSFFASL